MRHTIHLGLFSEHFYITLVYSFPSRSQAEATCLTIKYSFFSMTLGMNRHFLVISYHIKHISSYIILFQPIPASSRLFQPIPASSSLFQPIPAYSSLLSLFPHIPHHSSQTSRFQAIPD